MKFIHTSDIHIGAKFEMLGEKAPEQREQIKKTFSKIIKEAQEREVDLFLIAGDLFDSNNPPLKDIEFVQKELRNLVKSNIRVCLIPGNHDYQLSDRHGLGAYFTDIEGVYLFTDAEGAKAYFDDINTEVYAKANTTNKSSESPLVKVDEDRDAFKIIMAHGGVVGQAQNPEWPIDAEDISSSVADYVALGDWHSFRDESRGGVTAYYPGSPEMISISQSGAGYFIFATEENGKVNVESVKAGERNAKDIEISVSETETAEDVKSKIKEEADPNLVLTARIVGINTNKIIFDPSDLEEELGEEFWRLRVIDNTHLPVEEFTEEDYPSFMVSGQFVTMLKGKIENAEDEEERKLYEDALKTGLTAFEDPDVIH